MAFEILDYVKKRTLKNGAPLQVKIGVHTGPVISGVVGMHKPQFSLVGDTVNRTSRMCSKGEINKCHMTEDTQKFLKHLPDLRFESRQTDAKGLGVITTYIVYKKRTGVRLNNNDDDVQSLNAPDDQEEEEKSRVSDMFANSDDSRKLEIPHADEDVRNAHLEPQLSNLNPKKNDQIDHSILMDQDGSDDGKTNENKAKSVTFDLPKYLLFVKKKNKKYESYIFKKNVENYKFFFNVSIILGMLTFGLSEMSLVNEKQRLQDEEIVYLICLGIMGVLALALLYLSTQLTRKSPNMTVFVIYIFYSVCFVYAIFLDIDRYKHHPKMKINYFFFTMFMVCFVSHLRVLMFRHMIIFYTFISIAWVIIKIIHDENVIEDTIFLCMIVFSTLVNHYSTEVAFRTSFNKERYLNHEIKKTQALLRNLVPPNVFRGLLKGKRIADNLQNVTLLYTDMCGFTAFSKSRTPKEVVKLLSELFQRMDNLCIKNNVYKVHTIGDCYVVSGYTGKVSNEKRDIFQEAINVIETGFDMLDIIKTVREEMGTLSVPYQIFAFLL